MNWLKHRWQLKLLALALALLLWAMMHFNTPAPVNPPWYWPPPMGKTK